MEKKAHILAIDDDPTLLELFRRILEPAGYSVDTAIDGKLALTLLQSNLPDLILLDIKMPVLDGYEVLTLIRQHSNVPVIMVTGVRDTGSLDKALGSGADDYVTKPFHINELLARVQVKLRRSRHDVKPGGEARRNPG